MESDVTIVFLGFTPGAEILGATQANFAVDRPHAPAREVSVLLNAPAAAYLAEIMGREDTPEFREEAAKVVGHAWLKRCVEQGRHVDAVTFLSRSQLEMDPEFTESLKGQNPSPVHP